MNSPAICPLCREPVTISGDTAHAECAGIKPVFQCSACGENTVYVELSVCLECEQEQEYNEQLEAEQVANAAAADLPDNENI